jgi:hypothetical protein
MTEAGMDAQLATADPDSAWMTHLERAHALAHRAAQAIGDEIEPSEHLLPAAKELERGVVALYDAYDGRADRPSAIGVAHSRLWNAAILCARAGLSGALGSLRDACKELVTSEARYPLVPLAPRAAPLLRAGAFVPPLHSIERASLTPAFRAPPQPDTTLALPLPEIAEPTTFEELRAAAAKVREAAEAHAQALAKPASAPEPPEPEEEVPPGFAYAPPEAIDEAEFVHRWARICVEDVGMLGNQRAPMLGDDWRDAADLERRMIASIDAIAALGPTAIAHVEQLAQDTPAPDPMRIFAVTMIGGCLEGRDALGAAERALARYGAGDPAIAEAFAAALKLAPNPLVPSLLRSFWRSPDPAYRAIATDVLAYRGWLSPTDLETLAVEEDARLFALALPVLATTRHPAFDAALVRALEHDLPDVRAAALDAMALAAHRDAAAAARAAVNGSLGEGALVRLAIVGDEDDARFLLARLQASPTPAAAEAAGWAGLLDAVPPLIGLLETGDDDAKLHAGAALARLLGATLIDKIDLDAEELDDTPVHDPDPESPPERHPLAELVSDPRFLPPDPSKDTIELPSIDPEKWRAYWAEHGRNLDRKLRTRRGQPHSPSVSLYELDQLPLVLDDRCRLHRELAARTGRFARFEPHDFVAVQEQSLEAWAEHVRASKARPGSWGRVGR